MSETAFKQHTGLLSPWVDGMRSKKVARFIPREATVLDIGCGPGLLIPHLPSGCAYTGIDQNHEVVSFNKNRYPQHTFITFDAMSAAFPFKAETFDVIVLAAFLEHIKNPKVMLTEVARVLKPRGAVVATTPSGVGGRVHEVLAHLHLLSHDAAAEHETFLDRIQMERVLRGTGLLLDLYKPFQFGLNQLFILKKVGYR